MSKEYKFGINYDHKTPTMKKKRKYIMAYFKYKIDRDFIIDDLRTKYPKQGFEAIDRASKTLLA